MSMRKILGILMASTIILFALGIIVLTSAGSEIGISKHKDAAYFVNRQLIWFAIAMFVTFVVSCFKYRWWNDNPWTVVLLYAAVMTLLILVVTPGIRREVNGSYRWLNIAGLSLQPSEFSKVAIVLVLSVYLYRIGGKVRSFVKGLLVPAAIIVVPEVLLLAEPDYGSLAVVGATGAVMMFIAGVRWRYLIPSAFLGICVVGVFLAFNPNRMNRLRAWIDKSEGSENAAAHQLEMAREALMHGGAFGKGFMNSIQKHFYTPEAHTDFIFSIGGEEFGFVFSILVILFFALILVSGTAIAVKAPNRLGRLIAFGLTFLLVSQAIANIAVVTGLLPTKGLALPLFSYGGTNLIAAAIIIGTLINIGRHTLENEMEFRSQPVKNALSDF